MGDLFEVQEEIAIEVAQGLRPQLTQSERNQLRKRYTDNLDAYNEFLKGRFYYEEHSVFEFEESRRKPIEHYLAAIDLDPDFALAYYWLAVSYWDLAIHHSGSLDYFQKTREAAEKAIKIDPNLSLAYQIRANILWSWDKNWVAAEKEYKKASELDPNFQPNHIYLLWLGRRDEALSSIEKTFKITDRSSAANFRWRGWALFGARDFQGALEMGRKVLEKEPSAINAYWLVADACAALGEEEKEYEALREGNRRIGSWSERFEQAYRDSGTKGIRRVSLEINLRSGNFPPHFYALWYASLDEKDKAFEWLEKTKHLPLSIPFTTYPQLDSIRSDPRYEEYLRSLKLPEDVIAKQSMEWITDGSLK